jgi:hypothetical protein
MDLNQPLFLQLILASILFTLSRAASQQNVFQADPLKVTGGDWVPAQPISGKPSRKP